LQNEVQKKIDQSPITFLLH